MAAFKIDVILRTYNRADLLGPAVASFFRADHASIEARLLVVDNASSDGTPELLQVLAGEHGERLIALHEARPGGQHALNCGIARADAPVLGFFDDDEEIEENWLQVIRREMANPATDYIGGAMLPFPGVVLPDWLPQGYGGVLGIIDNGPERFPYGQGASAMLVQGNSAIRRSLFDQVGPYPDDLPTAEDRWLFQWLVAQGKRGYYCPDLRIRHVMQPHRMTRSYFRSWARREGRDQRVCERHAGEPSVLRRPWYWRSLAESGLRLAGGVASGWNDGGSFAAELGLRQAVSYIREVARGG